MSYAMSATPTPSWDVRYLTLNKLLQDTTGQSTDEFVTQSKSVVYAFNRLVARYIRSARTGTHEADGIYIYTADSYQKDWINSMKWADLSGFIFSLLKLVEVFALYKLGAYWLALLAGGSWAIILLCSTCLFALGLSREEDFRGAQIDMVVGELPIPTSVGGERVILLGLPAHTRRRAAWIVTWIVSAITCTVSLVMYYIILGGLEPMVFYTWAGFQFSWLIGRMLFFHLAGKRTSLEFTLIKRNWKELNRSYKARIRSLVYGLSAHLINVHPRGTYSYEDDTTSIPNFGTTVEEYPHIVDQIGTATMVHVASVIGDTMLTSACWVTGAASDLTGTTLYDSCIVQFLVGEKIISVPAARVLTGVRPSVPSDEEEGPAPLFPERGGGNAGPDEVVWVYWIPCGPGVWLQLKSKDRKIVGEITATVMSDEQITASLQSGEFFISPREVGEVNEIVRLSRKACRSMMGLIA